MESALRRHALRLVALLGVAASVGLLAAVPAFAQQMHLVPMSDGTLLSTLVWLPGGTGPWPVVLCRTPYGSSEWDPLPLLTRGYAAVCQDIRGFFGSGGVFWLFRDDGWGPYNEDGRETVDWILSQPWCDGNVATVGGSALGITQNLLAGALPAGVTCQRVRFAPSDFYLQAAFPGGAFRVADIATWLTSNGCSTLVDTVRAHPVKDAWWDWLDVGPRHPLVSIPTYQVGGWYDVFLLGNIRSFTGLQYSGAPGAGGNQKLLIGPWAHGGMGLSCTGQLCYPNAAVASGEALIGTLDDWWDYWQRGVPNGILDLPPVAYYVMGDPDLAGPWNVWRAAAAWPPPATVTAFYLHAGGSLDTNPPPAGAPPQTFSYDPEDPVPTLGGANLVLPQGPVDHVQLHATRSDILVFETADLDQATEIAGPVHVELWASSDRIDTDFTAMLCDVYPDGRVLNVCDCVLRARFRDSFAREEFLTPGVAYRFDIDLWETAITFAPGHRIRVAISSSNFPRYDANPNTGAPAGSSDTVLVATNTVYVDAAHPSRLLLAVGCGVATAVPRPGVPQPARSRLRLRRRGPNPFAEDARWAYELARPTVVRSAVYDVTGRMVRTLLAPSRQAGGVHEVRWDGRDARGRRVAGGVYFVRLVAGGRTATARAVVLR